MAHPSRFLHIKCSPDAKKEQIVVKIGNNVLRIAASPNKWFTNILLKKTDEISLIEGSDKVYSLEISDGKQYHPDQYFFDMKYNVKSHSLEGESVYYSIMGNIKNPRNILVTFPGVSNYDNVNYRLSALTSIQTRVQADTMVLAFQDKVGVYGNYMFETERGYPIRAIVLSLIRGLASKYGVSDENIVFYGNSKGGSIAIDFIKHFQKSNFFIDIPQLDLFNYKSQNDLMRYTTGVRARKYYNFLEYLPSVNSDLVTYSFGEIDQDASRGVPMKSFENINVAMLKDMEHSGSAMELVKRQFAKILQILNGTKISNRPAIKSVVNMRGRRLYFRRLLPAFKSEADMRGLYAEVTFLNGHRVFAVSLNKMLREDGVLAFWAKGFDFIKHLPEGRFQMNLVLYKEYREIVYPLNKVLYVAGERSLVTELSDEVLPAGGLD